MPHSAAALVVKGFSGKQRRSCSGTSHSPLVGGMPADCQTGRNRIAASCCLGLTAESGTDAPSMNRLSGCRQIPFPASFRKTGATDALESSANMCVVSPSLEMPSPLTTCCKGDHDPGCKTTAHVGEGAVQRASSCHHPVFNQNNLYNSNFTKLII